MREKNVQNAVREKKCPKISNMSKKILTYFWHILACLKTCVENAWKKCPGIALKNLSKTQHFCTTCFSHVFHTIFRPFFTRSSVLQFHVYAQVFTPYVRYFNAHLCFGLVFHAHILNIVSHMHFGHVFTPIVLATFSHSFTLTWRSRLPGCEVLALKSVMWKNPG